MNARLAARSTLTTGSRYQPGYSADGAVQVVERVERIGKESAGIIYLHGGREN